MSNMSLEKCYQAIQLARNSTAILGIAKLWRKISAHELILIFFKEVNCLFKFESDSNWGVLLAPLRTIQEKGEANVITVHRRKPSNPICFSANQLTLW